VCDCRFGDGVAKRTIPINSLVARRALPNECSGLLSCNCLWDLGVTAWVSSVRVGKNRWPWGGVKLAVT